VRIRLLLVGLAAVSIPLSLLPNAFAIGSAAAVIHENPEGATTEYTLLNQSQLTSTQFDIAAFAITTTGNTPTTTNVGWIAQALNSNTWSSAPMGGDIAGNLSWQQYTGMTWNQAFPNNPFKVNGYFDSYIWNSGAQTVSYPSNPFFPGEPFFGGFFFQGTPSSDFPADVATIHGHDMESGIPQPTAQGEWVFRQLHLELRGADSELAPRPHRRRNSPLGAPQRLWSVLLSGNSEFGRDAGCPRS
jgi:hypothetical protein